MAFTKSTCSSLVFFVYVLSVIGKSQSGYMTQCKISMCVHVSLCLCVLLYDNKCVFVCVYVNKCVSNKRAIKNELKSIIEIFFICTTCDGPPQTVGRIERPLSLNNFFIFPSSHVVRYMKSQKRPKNRPSAGLIERPPSLDDLPY